MRVHISDLAIVRLVTMTAGEGLGRIVRGVGIEEMDPQESRPPVCGPEPREGSSYGLFRADRSVAGVAPIRDVLRCDLVVVGVEPSRQAKSAVEHERAHECGGVIPGVAEALRQQGQATGDDEGPVVSNSVARWKQAGHQRRVRWQSQWGVGIGLSEKSALPGQGVEVRRLGRPRTVGADAIGPCRVKCDHEHVQRTRAVVHRPFAPPGGEAADPDPGKNDQCGGAHDQRDQPPASDPPAVIHWGCAASPFTTIKRRVLVRPPRWAASDQKMLSQ